MGNIAGIVITVTFFIVSYRIIELFARRKERMAIIDKAETLNNLKLSDLSAGFKQENKSQVFRNLHVALLMLGLGLGLLTSLIIIYNMPDLEYNFKELIYCSGMLIFGGIALLISFCLEIHYQQKLKQ